MTLRPYKFIVKAIPQILDDDGEVIAEEQNVQPVELIGCKALAKWAEEFPAKLAEAAAAQVPAFVPAPNRAAQRAQKPRT